MDNKEYEAIYEKDIKRINEMKIDKDLKDEILKMFDEINFHYNRIDKAFKLNNMVYDEEKEILLQNFIKQYERGEKLNKELSNYSKPWYRRVYDAFYNLLRKVYRKIRGR